MIFISQVVDLQISDHNGLRSIGADFITDANKKDNIDIICETTVDKVNFDTSGSEPRAVSVTLVDKSGDTRTVKARKEIILSGGAYCTPAILLRSGVGPRTELDKHGIQCVVESPGVGQNLLDHLIVFVFYEVNKDGLTNDHLVYHDDAAMAAYMLYKEKKTGILSTFPFGAFGFARLDERLKDEPLWKEAMAKRNDGRDAMGLTETQPNIEFFTTEV